jgi:hypothetical protein
MLMHSNNFIVLYLMLFSLLPNRGVHNVYNILAHVPAIDFQEESTFDMWSAIGE